MITLNISTSTQHKKQDLYKIFVDGCIECQITPTASSVKSKDKDNYKLEKGYCIKIFDFDRREFKTKIWEPLAKLLNLQCAFVIEDNEYMGCIQNWPNVFVKSNCKTNNCNKLLV